MNLLTQYLMRSILTSTSLVLVVLLALAGLKRLGRSDLAIGHLDRHFLAVGHDFVQKAHFKTPRRRDAIRPGRRRCGRGARG